MAIAFARISIHSRSQGHSAVAGAAYRSGQQLTDQRTGENHNFENRNDVVYERIMLPEGVDEHFLDREVLWNEAERMEKRKDAQVAKDIILALPKDLDLTQQISLARQFATSQFLGSGIPVDLAIHDHGDGNPHAHLYITTRRLGPNGFDRYKARDLNPSFANSAYGKGFVREDEAWSQRWRECQTAFFKAHDLSIEVDANHLVPQRHQGRIRGDEAHYLKEENTLRRQASIHIAIDEPESLLNLISQSHSVFTEHDIAKVIHKNTETIEQFQHALAKVKVHPDLIALGENKQGKTCYTTRAIFLKETQMMGNADTLLKQKHHQVSEHKVNAVLKHHHVTPEQATCLQHLSQPDGLSIIIGHAGTGKSYLLNAAQSMWQKAGFDVTGMAISGIAAKGLESASGIPSNTIAYYQKLRQHDRWPLSKKQIVVIDEAGMCDLNALADIVQHVKQAKAKLVLVGDNDQLQPIGPGAPFRALTERAGFAALSQILRQQDIGDRQATAWLSQGKVSKALQYYHAAGQIHFSDNESTAYRHLLEDWKTSLTSGPLPEHMILAHRNQDVDALNLAAREQLIQSNMLSDKGKTFCTEKGDINLAPGERLLFLKNNKELGVCNGQLGTITHLKHNKVTVQLDDAKASISFDSNKYQSYTYGYAQTIHKAQGATYDNVFVYAAGQYWDRHLSYVALSRHSQHVNLYSHREAYRDIAKLSQVMSQERVKDNILDWPLSFAMRRGFDADSLIGKLINTLGHAKEAMQDKWQWLMQRSNSQRREQTLKKEPSHTVSIDWTHPSFDKEWRQLTTIKQGKLYWLYQYRQLLNNPESPASTKSITQKMKTLAISISQEQRCLSKLQKLSPLLAQFCQQLSRPYHSQQKHNEIEH